MSVVVVVGITVVESVFVRVAGESVDVDVVVEVVTLRSVFEVTLLRLIVCLLLIVMLVEYVMATLSFWGSTSRWTAQPPRASTVSAVSVAGARNVAVLPLVNPHPYDYYL